jgi:two-component system, cell cycle sensor histidine kinase and response regulator CckA
MAAAASTSRLEARREVLGTSFEHWRALGESIPDILLLVDELGTILHVNRLPEPFAVEEITGTSVFDLALVEARDELRDSLQQTFATGRTASRELVAIHPDGDTRWYSTHTGPVRHGGRVVAAVVVARDVTDRRRTEGELRESEARYRIMIEHAPEAIVIIDGGSAQFVDANPNACTLYRLPHDRLIGADPMVLSPPLQANGEPSRTLAFRYINEALDGGAPVFDWIHRVGCDEEIVCQVRLVRLPGGPRPLVRGSIIDVTAQRRLDARVRQAQKLESLGLLASGIAHDFNNILTAVSGWAEMLAADVADQQELAQAVAAIRSAADRGAVFTRQLLTFARIHDTRPERQDLHRVVDDVTILLRPLVGENIVLGTRLDADTPFVRAGRGQLEQVLMNLILNARDAMPQGGRITLATSRVDAPGRPAVRLLVTDTGVGMDEETRGRAFEPLFTTKGPEAGTGLGLSTVRAIVSELGGVVAVDSEVGMGSSFEVVLPTM